MTIRTSIFMSLDNRTDASGTWQYPWFDEEFFSVLTSEWDRADALLIGARSFAGYEELATEHPESPMVAVLGAKPVVVASRSRTHSEVFDHAEFIGDLDVGTIRSVEEDHGNVLTLGSAACLVAMIENGAISTLNVTVIPTVVGSGPTLFESATRALDFTSVTARTLDSGVILLDLSSE